MLVYLMRHGEAEPRAAEDSLRCLTQRGSTDNLAMAGKLRDRLAAQFVPENHNGDSGADNNTGPNAGSGPVQKALVSPYVRARQTAAQLAGVFPGLAFEESPLLLPDNRPEQVLEALQGLDVDSLMLVGHNPLLSRLAGLLIDGDAGIGLGTSELICLQTEVLAPACGELRFYLTP